MDKQAIDNIVDKIKAEVKEVKDTNFGAWREYFVDQFEVEDPDAYDLVFSKTKPKPHQGGHVLECEPEIGKAESDHPNPFKRDWTQEEIDYVNSQLPKYAKHLYCDDTKEYVVFQVNCFKGTKGYFVSKPGYVAPQDVLPETVDAELSNGYSVLEIKTSDEMKTEGRFLHHCVGRNDMGYISKMESGTHRFFSLRNPEGEALITIEVKVSEGRVVQAYGEYNRLPGHGRSGNEVTKPEELAALNEWKKLRSFS